MKKIFYSLLLLALISCQKQGFESLIPEGVPGLDDLQKTYTQKLIDSEYGWFIDYRPNEANGSTAIWMKFKDNGTVSILSDYYGYDEVKETPRYRIGGAVFPELIFESYAVWHALYDNMGGNYQFRITPIDHNSFKISDAVVPTEAKNFVLRKATASDFDNVKARGEINKKIVDFRSSSEAYFQNINLQNFTGSWEIDNFLRKITFTWPDSFGYPMSQTYPYHLTKEGIKFFSTIKPGSIAIDSISFGAFHENNIEVTSAGAAGLGSVTVSHNPAFPFVGSVDYFLMASRPTERQLLNVALTDFSPNLAAEVENLKTLMPGVVRLQVYVNDLSYGELKHRMSFYFPSSDGSGSIYCNSFYGIEKTSEDQAKFVFIQKNTNGKNYAQATDPLLDKMFPSEGVTIVPYTNTELNQKLRIVSRADSRNYFTLSSTTANYFYRP